MHPEDAAIACEAGADAFGMIFHPASKRNISLERARLIMATAGPFVTPVGVFVDATVESILSTAQELGLRVVQLHGQEEPAMVSQLIEARLTVLKAVRVDESLPATLERWRDTKIPLAGIVLETGATADHGGSGIANDWNAVAQFQAAGHFNGLGGLIAAGGLTPETVASVIKRIRPWAVDVSSGVETSPGKKSPERLRAFIEQVKRADSID